MNKYIKYILHKLADITGDFVRNDDSWKNWGYSKLIESLKKWTESNILNVDQRKESPKKEILVQTSQGKQSN